MPSAHPTPKLFADRGCPFAHRVIALLDHLEEVAELSIAPVGEKPEGLSRYSSSGRIPLLVHGALVIGESRVMLEHLAEAYDFTSAYPLDLEARSIHRHAMALMDGFVAPRVIGANAPVDLRMAECLDVFERLTVDAPHPSLVAFHLAPFWLRFQWWRPDGAVTQAIRARRKLADWLDGAAALAAVARTAPDPGANTADFK